MVVDTGIFIDYLRSKDKSKTILQNLPDDVELYISPVNFGFNEKQKTFYSTKRVKVARKISRPRNLRPNPHIHSPLKSADRHKPNRTRPCILTVCTPSLA
jgi:hypothetical protein